MMNTRLLQHANGNSDEIHAQGLEIPAMGPEACVQFLLDRGGLGDESDISIRAEATKIVTELGSLPLAVEHAATYVRMSNLNEYLSIFSKQCRVLLEWRHK